MSETLLLDDYQIRNEDQRPFLKHGLLAEDLLWSGRPKPYWDLRWYNLFLTPLMFFWGATFLTSFVLSLSQDGAFDFLSLLIGSALLYYSFPYYIRRYLLLRNARYALTKTRILRLSGRRLEEFDLDKMRNVVYVPTQGHYGNIGFLYKKKGNWKNYSLKELSHGQYLYQQLMDQLERSVQSKK